MTAQIVKTFDPAGVIGSANPADFTSMGAARNFFQSRNPSDIDENYFVDMRANAEWYVDTDMGNHDDLRRVTWRPAPGYSYAEKTSHTKFDASDVGITMSFPLQNFNAPIASGNDFENLRILFPNTGDKAALVVGHGGGTVDVNFRFCRFLDQSGTAHETLKPGAGYSRILIEDSLIAVDSVANKTFIKDDIGCRFRRITFVALNASKGSTKFLDSSYGATYLEDSIMINGGANPLNNVTATNCWSNTNVNNYSGVQVNTAVGALVVDETSDYRPTANGPLIGTGSDAGDRKYDIIGSYRGEVPDVGAWQTNVQSQPQVSQATITSVEYVGQTVVVKLDYTSIATGGKVKLIPDATNPNGAAVIEKDVVLGALGKATATLRGVLPGNYSGELAAMTNNTGTGGSTGGKAFTIVVPAATEITIEAVRCYGNGVEVMGFATNTPTDGTVTLKGGNGLADVGPLDITFDDVGKFNTYFSNVPNGIYSKSIATAENYSGTSTAEGEGIAVYAAGQKPAGTAAVRPTPYKAKAFNAPSVADGATFTTQTLENTTAVVAVNQPFTFGLPFKKGALKMTDSLVGKIAGQADVQLQFDPKSTWSDGSVMHGIVSGILPSIAASAKVQMAIARSTAARSNVGISPASMAAAAIDATFTANIAGVDFVATADTVLNAGLGAKCKTWLSGPVCTEFLVTAPLVSSVDGSVHPVMEARFNIRYYPSIGVTKMDTVIENGIAFNAQSGDVLYDAKVVLAGVTKYTKTGLKHFHACRWKRTDWSTPSAIHTMHEVAYTLDTKLFPNWNRNLVITDAILDGYVADLAQRDVGPMGTGRYYSAMGTVGGRPDIGLAPQWHVHWVLCPDKRIANYAKLHGDVAGCYPVHMRDPNTGNPVDCLHYPYITKLGGSGDANNPDTGKNEHFLNVATAGYTDPDASHHSAFTYIPYVLTGDHFYMEELGFWATWCVNFQNCIYRHRDEGLMISDQMRAQGWVMRDLGELWAITPDDDPMKATYRYLTSAQLKYYNSTYTDNPNANQVGYYTDGYTVSYNGGRGIACWQQDFTTMSFGHAAELDNPEAVRAMKWLAKFQLSRILNPDICYIHSAIYALNIHDGDFKWYPDITTCYKKTLSATALSLPCASQELADQMDGESNNAGIVAGEIYGLAQFTEGYPANYMPALSMAQDIAQGTSIWPNSDTAYDVFKLGEKRPPPYANEPQWDVLPRTWAVQTQQVAPTVLRNVVAQAVATGYSVSWDEPTSWGSSGAKGAIVRLSDGTSKFSETSPVLIDAAPGTTASMTISGINQQNLEGPASASQGPLTVPGSQTTTPTITGVTISPKTATGSRLFTAGVNGTNSPLQSVSWECDLGTVVAASATSAQYTAPDRTDVEQIAHLKAKSTVDPSFYDTAIITIPALPPTPTVTDITVRPGVATVQGNGSLQLSATITGRNNPSQEVTWSTDLGQVNVSGYFIAPAATSVDQVANVTATSVQDPSQKKTIQITISAASMVPVVTGVVVTPATATVNGGESLSLSADVVGLYNPPDTVTWSLTGPGSVVDGQYQAPAATDSIQIATVKATSTLDPQKFGVAALVIPAKSTGGTTPPDQLEDRTFAVQLTSDGLNPVTNLLNLTVRCYDNDGHMRFSANAVRSDVNGVISVTCKSAMPAGSIGLMVIIGGGHHFAGFVQVS